MAIVAAAVIRGRDCAADTDWIGVLETIEASSRIARVSLLIVEHLLIAQHGQEAGQRRMSGMA